jgi:glycosyltransferase involved in cell wall biosynthesis
MIKTSVVITVKNDEAGIKRLLTDLKKQTVKPDEVIVVMAGKGVYRNLKEFNGDVRVVLAKTDCTRGKGRNIGVRMARNELIAVTDVGCRPERDWVERITAGLNKGRAFEYKGQALFVVAGWYRAVAETTWQKAFLPYLAPKARAVNYLPASRSIAFTKSAWELVGGYPEDPVSGGEDLKFADNLYKNPEVNMIFEPEALVDWPVPVTLSAFIKDIVKHTRGNFEAGYWPHISRNLSVVARWMIMAIWPWVIPGYLITAGLNKGQALLRQGLALQALRMIAVRMVADAAVVYGTVIGIIDGWVIKKLRLRVLGG